MAHARRLVRLVLSSGWRVRHLVIFNRVYATCLISENLTMRAGRPGGERWGGGVDQIVADGEEPLRGGTDSGGEDYRGVLSGCTLVAPRL